MFIEEYLSLSYRIFIINVFIYCILLFIVLELKRAFLKPLWFP